MGEPLPRSQPAGAPAIEAGLDDAGAVALLVGAVERASPSGGEAALARYLVERMRPWAERAVVDEVGNAVAWFGQGPRTVILLGHIDTAPGWWPVRREGNVLHGRGSVDAKGSLCAMITAASRLPAAVRDRLSLQVIAAVEEEVASSKGARHALQAYPRPDLVIVGEPSGWDALTLGYKGRLLARFETERPEGHGARDDATAAARAARAWQLAQAWASSRNPAGVGPFDAVQASLTALGSSSDGLRQRAHALIGFRLPPGLEPGVAEAELRARLAELTARPGTSLTLSGHERAHRDAGDGPAARALRVAIRSQGGRPRHLLKTGTSDMNVIAPVWGVPIVAYGPGDAGLDNAPDERLDVAEYLKAVNVLERALTTLAG